MTSWDDLAPRLHDLLDGRLDAAAEREVRALLARHPEHARRFAELEALRAALRTLQDETAPPNFAAGVLERLDRDVAPAGGGGGRPLLRMLRVVLPVAAAVLIGFFGWFAFQGGRATVQRAAAPTAEVARGPARELRKQAPARLGNDTREPPAAEAEEFDDETADSAPLEQKAEGLAPAPGAPVAPAGEDAAADVRRLAVPAAAAGADPGADLERLVLLLEARGDQGDAPAAAPTRKSGRPEPARSRLERERVGSAPAAAPVTLAFGALAASPSARDDGDGGAAPDWDALLGGVPREDLELAEYLRFLPDDVHAEATALVAAHRPHVRLLATDAGGLERLRRNAASAGLRLDDRRPAPPLAAVRTDAGSAVTGAWRLVPSPASETAAKEGFARAGDPPQARYVVLVVREP